MREDENNVMIDLGRLIYQLYKNIPVIGMTALAFALAGLLISSFIIQPKYSASAQMLVNNRGDDQQQSTSISQSDINAASSLVDTYAIILKSYDVLEKVKNECRLDDSLEKLSSMISVKAVNSTQVMRITVENNDPQKAINICSSLVKLAPDAIINAIDAGSVSTISSPYTTGRPISPSKRNFTLIGGLLGLFLSAAYIVIRELTNDKFKTTEDVRQVLDLNILGVIPEEDMGRSVRKKKVRKGGQKHGTEKKG